MHAPINITGHGVRWSSCAKCRKIRTLDTHELEGHVFYCAGCGEQLTLKKMSMVEWEALAEQYPQPPSPVMTTIKPSIVAQWECPSVDKIEFVQGSFNIETGDAIEPLHKRSGTFDPITLRLTSERDSTEADAAQGLFLNHGTNPNVLMRATKNGCVFARAEVKTLVSGRSYVAIPSNRPVSITSPLAIQMLMHFYGTRERFISAPLELWPPAQRGIVEGFKNAGLIFERDHEDFGTTDKGSLIVATLKAVMSESLRNV